MEDFLMSVGIIGLVLAGIAVLIGVFYLINRFIEYLFVKRMNSNVNRTAVNGAEIDVEDSENDELIAVITAAIAVAMQNGQSGQGGQSVGGNEQTKSNTALSPDTSRAPFVIRRVRPL